MHQEGETRGFIIFIILGIEITHLFLFIKGKVLTYKEFVNQNKDKIPEQEIILFKCA